MYDKHNNCLYYVTKDSHTPNRPIKINLEKECGLEHLGYKMYDTGHMRRVDYFRCPDNTTQLLKFKTCAIFVDNKSGKATTLLDDPWRFHYGRIPTEEEVLNAK